MPQPTPVTTSRLPWIAIGVWALILALIVGAGLMFASRGAASSGDGVGSGGSRPAALVPQADPSASPSASPNGSAGASSEPSKPGKGVGNGPRKLPEFFGMLGRGKGSGGFGPFGGAAVGRGAISITAINGTQLSLKTDDGWTRTIDAAGATIKSGDQAITVADLKVGDQIRFRETRNADGTWKITEIVVVPAQTAGTVKSVDGSTVTITRRDGSTQTITLSDRTTFSLGRQAGSKADVKVGLQIAAQGSVAADGTFTATKVFISPSVAIGQVTAKTATSITIKTLGGGTSTINVTSATTYTTRGKQSASLADVAVNTYVQAEGTLAADGSLTATAVRIFPNAIGKGNGQFRGPAKNQPQPSPSSSAGTTAG